MLCFPDAVRAEGGELSLATDKFFHVTRATLKLATGIAFALWSCDCGGSRNALSSLYTAAEPMPTGHLTQADLTGQLDSLGGPCVHVAAASGLQIFGLARAPEDLGPNRSSVLLQGVGSHTVLLSVSDADGGRAVCSHGGEKWSCLKCPRRPCVPSKRLTDQDGDSADLGSCIAAALPAHVVKGIGKHKFYIDLFDPSSCPDLARHIKARAEAGMSSLKGPFSPVVRACQCSPVGAGSGSGSGSGASPCSCDAKCQCGSAWSEVLIPDTPVSFPFAVIPLK